MDGEPVAQLGLTVTKYQSLNVKKIVQHLKAHQTVRRLMQTVNITAALYELFPALYLVEEIYSRPAKHGGHHKMDFTESRFRVKISDTTTTVLG